MAWCHSAGQSAGSRNSATTNTIRPRPSRPKMFSIAPNGIFQITSQAASPASGTQIR
jgi:hypothetical protein